MLKHPQSNIPERLGHIIAREFGLVTSVIKPEKRFIQDLEFDSLDWLEFLAAAEREFGLTIPSADVDHLKTVQEFTNYLTNRLT